MEPAYGSKKIRNARRKINNSYDKDALHFRSGEAITRKSRKYLVEDSESKKEIFEVKLTLTSNH